MPGGIIAGLKFGEAIATLWTQYLTSSDRRKTQKAIEAAEKYIQVNERSGEFSSITNARRDRLLRHYSKRFWHYN